MEELYSEIICEYYSMLDRQGPGSVETTLKALSFIQGLSSKSKILDVGCGTGGQTMTLANNTQGNITGIDIFPKFIELFNANIQNLNFGNRVSGVVSSMENLPFEKEEFDLIWSEGAIYNIGFERGLSEWKKFLKKGGYIAVSEISWFTDFRPEEIDKFWKETYPEVNVIGNKVNQMQKIGYIPVASFILPENCWIDNFYKPQNKIQKNFLEKFKNNKLVEEFITKEKREAELYEKYKEFYGYVFYIGKKI